MELPFKTPIEAVQCFARALDAKDESAARVASTKEGFTPGPAEGPGAFFHRLLKTETRLEPLAHLIKEREGMAIVPAAASTGDAPPLPLFFFLDNPVGSWRITGVSRSPAYAKKVFFGEAPALLDITQLPQEPAVVPWAEALIARFDGDSSAANAVPAVDDLIRRWKAFADAEPGNSFIKRTVQVPWFDRAAIQFAHELPTYEETMWMVAQKEDQTWVPVWFGHDFSPSRLFLNLEP